MSFSEVQTTALKSPLDPKRIKERAAGNGNKLSYIETHDAIRTANRIFGFGKWGHRVENLNYLGAATVTNLNTKKEGIHVGYLCTVALSVEGCEVTSGIGYGDATEYRPTAHVTAHELAAKEAESDALKRALKNYGDQFGLALYAKDARTAGHIGSAGTTSGTVGAPADSTPPQGQPSSTPAAAGSPIERARAAQPQQSDEGVPDGHVRAANVTIGFGKNADKTVGELTAKQLPWYAGRSESETVKAFDPGSDAHKGLVKRAAEAFLDEGKDATVAVDFDGIPF